MWSITKSNLQHQKQNGITISGKKPSVDTAVSNYSGNILFYGMH